MVTTTGPGCSAYPSAATTRLKHRSVRPPPSLGVAIPDRVRGRASPRCSAKRIGKVFLFNTSTPPGCCSSPSSCKAARCLEPPIRDGRRVAFDPFGLPDPDTCTGIRLSVISGIERPRPLRRALPHATCAFSLGRCRDPLAGAEGHGSLPTHRIASGSRTWDDDPLPYLRPRRGRRAPDVCHPANPVETSTKTNNQRLGRIASSGLARLIHQIRAGADLWAPTCTATGSHSFRPSSAPVARDRRRPGA